MTTAGGKNDINDIDDDYNINDCDDYMILTILIMIMMTCGN